MPTKSGYRKIRALIAITLGALSTNVAAAGLDWCGSTFQGHPTAEALRCAEKEKGGGRSSTTPSIPTYDVDARCASIFAGVSPNPKYIPPSNRLQRKCVDDEQSSYNNLTTVWDEVNPRGKAFCLSQTEHFKNSPREFSYYHFLEVCVARALEAQENQRKGTEPVPKFRQ